jgi:hypothetical protein
MKRAASALLVLRTSHLGWTMHSSSKACFGQARIDQHIASFEASISPHSVLLLPIVELQPCEAVPDQAGNAAPAPCAMLVSVHPSARFVTICALWLSPVQA